MPRLILVTLFALDALVSTATSAQYPIDWYTIDAGGGTSADGVYSLSGTVGQADAEIVSLCSADGGAGCVNPSFEVTGGFWVGSPGLPTGPAPGCGDELDCLFRNGFEG